MTGSLDIFLFRQGGFGGHIEIIESAFLDGILCFIHPCLGQQVVQKEVHLLIAALVCFESVSNVHIRNQVDIFLMLVIAGLT